MHTLFLDLASHAGMIACVASPPRAKKGTLSERSESKGTDDAVVASQQVDHRISDAELMPLVESLMKEAGWKLSDIQRIACVIGPGGFTSLRVAAAFTNALAFVRDVSAAGIHLSDLYVARSKTMDVLWLHSTKKEELFVRGFGVYTKIFPEAAHVTLTELLGKFPEGAPWTGELLPAHEASIKERGGERAKLKDLADILPSFLAGLPYGKKTVVPWYGRGW